MREELKEGNLQKIKYGREWSRRATVDKGKRGYMPQETGLPSWAAG